MAIITLTTDFGSKDYVAGAFKGILHSLHAAAVTVDISHEIPPSNFAEACYIFANSVGYYPQRSFHLLLVSLFEKAGSKPVLAYHQGQYYGCTNNGLLPMVLQAQPEAAVLLPMEDAGNYNVLAWAAAYAKAIEAISQGKPLEKIGTPLPHLEEMHRLLPNYGPDFIDGRIIFIDRFQNVVVNITRQNFEEIGRGRPFAISFGANENITRLSQGYPEAGEGKLLAFFNAVGNLEIAINKGNAAGLFGLQTFNSNANQDFIKSRMFYQTVRIVFFDKAHT